MKFGGLLGALVVGLIMQATPAHASDKPERLTVVTAGDSITEGVGARRGWSWPDQLSRKESSRIDVVNVGHKGACLLLRGCIHPDTLLKSFRSEVLRLRPDVAIVSIGRNDLCHITVSDYKDTLRGLRRDAESVGTRLIYGTITPVNKRWGYPCETQQAELNTWLRKRTSTIDFADALSTRAGELRKGYDSGDGLHPNAAGYRVMARLAARSLLAEQ